LSMSGETGKLKTVRSCAHENAWVDWHVGDCRMCCRAVIAVSLAATCRVFKVDVRVAFGREMQVLGYYTVQQVTGRWEGGTVLAQVEQEPLGDRDTNWKTLAVVEVN
jgi:hypothetical protein